LSLNEIRRYAQFLAQEAWDADDGVQAIYWFPDEHEVRIIEACHNTVVSLSGCVEPFYFNATEEVPFPSGIAVIRPQEVGNLTMPEGWGKWEQGIKLREVTEERKMDENKLKTKRLVDHVKMMGLTPMFTHMHRIYPTDTGLNKILGGTTCVLFNECMQPVARGNCIVSKKDRPIRAVGRYISLKRAIKAFFDQVTFGKLCTWNYFQNNYYYFKHFEECRGYPNTTFIPECVSEKELKLTLIEKKRVANRLEKKRPTKRSKKD
jgi:hypothetical protein